MVLRSGSEATSRRARLIATYFYDPFAIVFEKSFRV